MKITLKSIPTIVFTVLCFCGISFATTIDFNQSNYNVNIGDSFSADLGIAGLGDMSPDSLGVFDIDVIYDSTILSLSAVTFGDPVLGDQLDVLGLGSIASATPSVGSVNVYELSLDLEYDLESLQAGAFTLFSLNFDTIAEGNSALTISINSLGDSLGAPCSIRSTILMYRFATPCLNPVLFL